MPGRTRKNDDEALEKDKQVIGILLAEYTEWLQEQNYLEAEFDHDGMAEQWIEAAATE